MSSRFQVPGSKFQDETALKSWGSPLFNFIINIESRFAMSYLKSWNLEPETWNLFCIPKSWNLELGTWNLELGTWNLELGTWNLFCIPKSWNLELGTWNLEPGTWNLELGT